MRILLVITSLGVGGAERLVTTLADRFAARGHEVALVFFHGKAHLRPSDPRVRLKNLNMKRSPLGVLVAVGRLRKIFREFQPDVVNSHLVHANILSRVLRVVTRIPCLVSSAHNTNEEGRGRMLAYRLTDSLADISTNVSEDAVRVFEREGAVRSGRMLAIHNGIDTARFQFDEGARQFIRKEMGVDQSTSLLLAVGRLCEAKDYPTLLKAFASLKQCSFVQLAIVGEGTLQDELVAITESLGITDQVRFLGVRHDISALMSACDVFVLSSAWEGFGLVVAEAMACERVVVATDSGGVKEVVGEAGFVVEPKNSRSLARGIEQGLNLSVIQRTDLGVAARKRIEEGFSLDATVDRYLAVYQGGLPEIIAEGKR